MKLPAILWVAIAAAVLMLIASPSGSDRPKTLKEEVQDGLRKMQARSEAIAPPPRQTTAKLITTASPLKKALAFFLGGPFIMLVTYAAIRIQCVSSSDKFFCAHHELAPRWGFLGLLLMFITVPASGMAALWAVGKWLVTR